MSKAGSSCASMMLEPRWEWNSLRHWLYGRVGDGLSWSCQALCCLLFYFLFSLSPFLGSGTTEINCSSPGWTVGGFCLLGLPSGGGETSLVVFESMFWDSTMLFGIDKLVVKDGLERGNSVGIS